MALSSSTVWEVRTTGNQNNGGGYTSGGTDYSIYDAAELSPTDLACLDTSTTLTSAIGGFTAAMIGNIIHITEGTNFTAGWYEITARTDTNTVTIDRTAAAAGTNATAGVGAVGGAFLIGGTLDNDLFNAIVAGNTVWIAAGTYTVGESIPGQTAGTALLPIKINGYNAARGDNPALSNRPVIVAGTWEHFLGAYRILRNLQFITAFTQGIRSGGYTIFVNCKATGTSTSNYPAFYFSVSDQLIGCEAVSRTGTAFYSAAGGFLFSCYAHDSGRGVYFGGSGGTVINSVIDTCQNGITFGGASNYTSITGNTIRNCLRGISGVTDYGTAVLNNIIADCVTGANWSTPTPHNWFDYNCWSNNGTDVSGVSKGSHDVTADALLVSGTAKGTDGATGGTGLVFTAASNPFGSVTTSDCLNITVAGSGATLGVYVISSVDTAGQITLATSAGASKTDITYCIVKGNDFTLGAGSPCFAVGLSLGANVGL